MGLIDKLCLWICKGKLKSVVLLDTDWFARADGIARMKGWKVKHMHPLRRIYDEGSEDWISYFEEPMPAGVVKDFSFANKTYLLQIIGESHCVLEQLHQQLLRSQLRSLSDGTCQNIGFLQLKSSI